MIDIYFSDFFEVEPELLEEYGAFNVSLINDLPLFIDPFLLFNSEVPTYKGHHESIIRYVKFLRDKSITRPATKGLLQAWYMFGEVDQNWFGFSKVGNKGSGLGIEFARALHENLNSVFTDFGAEKIAQGSHLEKLCLVSEGVGRDNISDFTTNLIKEFLLDYTRNFALEHIRPELRKVFTIERVRFNYTTETWSRDKYELPCFGEDYVLLTPKNILTRDEIWISRKDLLHEYHDIASAVPNAQLREQINNYFASLLAPNPTAGEINNAKAKVYRQFPELLEYYIRSKEDSGDLATTISSERVSETEEQFILHVVEFVDSLLRSTGFYERRGNTYTEARERVDFLKDVIENKDGYKLFYMKGQPIKREADLQILFRLTWYGTPSDVNREVNNGRGPVDFTISRGSADKSLVEFKLASNSQLKRNLANQVPIYEKASDADKSIKVILYFSESELARVASILRELKLEGNPDIVLIDARSDNKPSASKA